LAEEARIEAFTQAKLKMDYQKIDIVDERFKQKLSIRQTMIDRQVE
jgi:hypothetical protein